MLTYEADQATWAASHLSLCPAGPSAGPAVPGARAVLDAAGTPASHRRLSGGRRPGAGAPDRSRPGDLGEGWADQALLRKRGFSSLLASEGAHREDAGRGAADPVSAGAGSRSRGEGHLRILVLRAGVAPLRT